MREDATQYAYSLKFHPGALRTHACIGHIGHILGPSSPQEKALQTETTYGINQLIAFSAEHPQHLSRDEARTLLESRRTQLCLITEARLLTGAENPYDGLTNETVEAVAKARGMSVQTLKEETIKPALERADRIWQRITKAD